MKNTLKFTLKDIKIKYDYDYDYDEYLKVNIEGYEDYYDE